MTTTKEETNFRMNIDCQDCSNLSRNQRTYNLSICCPFWGLVVAGLIGFSGLAYKFWPYTMDDAYITYRYAQNFATGQGLVFNTGEQPRAEGITSPLYAVLLSLTPIGMPTVSKIIGLVSAVLTALLVGVIIFRLCRCLVVLHRPALLLISAAGSCYYLLNPYVVGNSVSGMETSLAGLALVAFLFCMLQVTLTGKPPSYFRLIITGIIGTVVPMLRPEMGLVVIVSILGLFFIDPHMRRSGRIIMLTFLGFGAVYFLARYIYYQDILPLPFYLKQDGIGLHGWSELSAYIDSNIILALNVFACLAIALAPKSRSSNPRINGLAITLIAAISCQVLYYATIRHIMGFGLRYFQPIAAGVVILGFVGAARVWGLLSGAELRKRLSIPVVFIGLFVLLLLGNVNSYWNAKHVLVDWYAEMYGTRQITNWQPIIDASRDLKLHVAMNDCGKFPYYTGFRILDLAGLNNRAIAKSSSLSETLREIKDKNPSLVILCGTDKDKPDALFGWEKLCAADVDSLGYDYVGAIKVGLMSDKREYYWLLFTRADEATCEFIDRLARSGIFEYVSLD